MVRVHPLAVVIAVALGAYAAGIIGAVVAVPLVAVANTVAAYLVNSGSPSVPAGQPSSPTPLRSDLKEVFDGRARLVQDSQTCLWEFLATD